MLEPASSGGVDIAASGYLPSATATATGLGSRGGGWAGWVRLEPCIAQGQGSCWVCLKPSSSAGQGSCWRRMKGCAAKPIIRASRAWCIVRSAHRGTPLLHVAMRTGHLGGGCYDPMSLCSESADDVKHPTEILLLIATLWSSSKCASTFCCHDSSWLSTPAAYTALLLHRDEARWYWGCHPPFAVWNCRPHSSGI
jgi:hypothetical protein